MPSTIVSSSTDSRLSTNGTTATAEAPPGADVSGQLMQISPEMASELLKRRLPNRPVSKARIRVMITDMREGRWVFNGEPIILSEDLALIDGQHRLMAVAEAGVTVPMMVIVGIGTSADVLMSIDQGQRKTAGDLLHMVGLTQARELASAARWLFRFERQCMRDKAMTLRSADVPAFVEAHPALQGALPWGRLVRDLLPQSIASMLYFVMAQKDAALSKRFFDALAHGDALKRDHPAHGTREKLLRDKSPKNHAGVLARGALCVLAWNCVRLERAMPGSLTWKGLTDKAVAFPEVV